MSIFESRYYRLSQRVHSFVGQWPYQTWKEKLIRRLVVVFIMLSADTCLNASIFTTDFTLEIATDFIPYTTLVVIAILQYYLSAVNEEKAKKILNKIMEDWDTIKDKDDLLILQNTTEEGRVYIFGILVYLAVSTISYLIMAITPALIQNVVWRNRSALGALPFQFEYFVDPEKYFYAVLLDICACSMLTIGSIALTTAMFLMFTQHATALFKLAGFQMEHAFEDMNERYDGKNVGASYEKMIRCVEYHRKALIYINDINEIYSWSHLISLFLSMLSISTSLFCAAVFVGKWKTMLKALVTACAQMGYIFFLTYGCQRLTDTGLDILQCAYFSQWYKAPNNLKKLLLFIMMKSGGPVFITGPKVLTGNLETYTSVMRMCMSLFTGLCSLQS